MAKLASHLLFFVLWLSAAAAPAQSQQHAHHAHHAPHAGQQQRVIKSLSADDIAEIERGGGWGLAKAAELNGLPGPIHLLELRVEIDLSDRQIEQITKLYERMRDGAIREGKRLIAAERALNELFAHGDITEASLRETVMIAEQSRGRLRTIHLSAHMQTPAILSAAQVARYKLLRSYTKNPCTHVPVGHDPAMWKRHNDCD